MTIKDLKKFVLGLPDDAPVYVAERGDRILEGEFYDTVDVVTLTRDPCTLEPALIVVKETEQQ